MAPLENETLHNDAVADIQVHETLSTQKDYGKIEYAPDRKDALTKKDKESSSRRVVSVCLPPMHLMVHGLVNHKVVGGNCKKLVTGGILQENVKCVLVSSEWFHNLDGFSRLILTLYDNQKRVQKRVDVFGKPPKRGFTAYRYFSKYEPIVALAKPGYFYQLEIKVAKGKEDSVTLAGLICKIIPTSAIGESMEFTDSEDIRGRYRGECENGKPDGRGIIDYENGRTFVGSFANGKWSKGVEYRGNDVISTMKNGFWDEQVDMTLAKQYDYKVHFFARPCKKIKKSPEKNKEQTVLCGAFACLS